MYKKKSCPERRAKVKMVQLPEDKLDTDLEQPEIYELYGISYPKAKLKSIVT